jgi:hypothetical protein
MNLKEVTKEVKTLVSIARTADLKKVAIPFYELLPSWCFPERHLRFKAYCVGMGKTGTTSMHAIFSNQYRSAHEPEYRFLIAKILAFVKGDIDKIQFIQYVKHQDRRLGLEMNSSGLNYFLIDILVNEFNDAKFILTIRDCYSWLDSLITYWIAAPIVIERHWWKRALIDLADFRFGANKFQHAQEENILADKGLYTLDGYFSYWREHNSKIIATIPKERLLVIKTQEIDQSIRRIEEFLGIPLGTLPNKVRENVRRKKFNFLSQIDKDFLEEKANFHCKELMGKYFPEMKGFTS